jgi:hypothetical protein
MILTYTKAAANKLAPARLTFPRYPRKMKTLFILILVPLGVSHAATPKTLNIAPAIADERLYLRLQKEFLKKEPKRLRPDRMPARMQRVALDAIEDLLSAGAPLLLDSLITPKDLSALIPKEQIRWHRLRYAKSHSEAAEQELLSRISNAEPDAGLLYELYRLPSSLAIRSAITALEQKIPEAAERWKMLTGSQRNFIAPTHNELIALWRGTKRVNTFQTVANEAVPRLFLFCRKDRKQKCLLLMRDKQNQPVRNPGGSLWSHPALGLSSRGLPFNVRNGYTPQGIHIIRGVMPEANFPEIYGRHRRLILDWIPKSTNEMDQLKLLPEESHQRDWWKEAVIARDMGRGELRIHGTGERNDEPTQPYYPLVPTIGCVSQREMRYGSSDYIDQRLLLDRLMRASGLSVRYSSEPLIQGLLYIIEITASGGAVTAAELARVGIE